MAPPPTVNPTAARLPSEVLPNSTAARAAAAFRILEGNAVAPSSQTVDTSAAIGELVEALKTTSVGLRFEIDETTHRVITKVIDKETGDLIRQMPTEEVLRIARAIDKLQGLFISQAA